MKIYKAAIIGLGPSGLAVNKILYGDSVNEIIAFENEDIHKRDNFFGFWLTDWMKPFEKIIEKRVLSKKGLFIIHRHKKDKLPITEKINILDVRTYGISKVYIAN